MAISPLGGAEGTVQTSSSIQDTDPALPTNNTGSPAHAPPSARSPKPCRYFGTDSGCRLGHECPFLHDVSRLPKNSISTLARSQENVPAAGERQSRRQAVTKAQQSKVVQKPVPQAQVQDPREFQLGQIRRRFKPKESQLSGQSPDGSTVFDFSMAPSDPDFPFEIDTLQCSLVIPPSYPGLDVSSRPKLRIKNRDIPRGFAINVENGFRRLAEERQDATLLALMSTLDKNLEAFLSEKKAETVTLVANVDRRHLAALPVRSLGTLPRPSSSGQAPTETSFKSPKLSEPEFTSIQKAEASSRRDAETRQLEARMGRMPLFKKSRDGIAYIIPIEPRKRSELPGTVQAIKVVQLFVPLLYPLHSCRISLDGVSPEDSKTIETAFENRAKQAKELTLMNHLNYLAQNMYVMAKEVVPTSQSSIEPSQEPGKQEGQLLDTVNQEKLSSTTEDDRAHIKVIPRPPEWTTARDSDESPDTDDYSYDSGDESEDGGIGLDPESSNTARTLQPVERGTAISFPFIELYGIELLEVTTLNLTVRCDRCKDSTDITGLKSGISKSESCKKCATVFQATFRHQPVHENAVRAGFLDLEGCTVIDLLPSAFIPTCSGCSTPYPAPGIISVRGETTTNVCRECHQRFTFKLPDVKFLRITSSHLPPTTGPRRKRETLGLTAGTELPKRGRCRHYTKSYRWFRFSCCSKVYACDKCHDEVEEHPNEHANRMICGWCSREQNYRPENCGICHAGLIGKRGTGFWEGGKGTRDRVKMSRKDKRKYRRVGEATNK